MLCCTTAIPTVSSATRRPGEITAGRPRFASRFARFHPRPDVFGKVTVEEDCLVRVESMGAKLPIGFLGGAKRGGKSGREENSCQAPVTVHRSSRRR